MSEEKHVFVDVPVEIQNQYTEKKNSSNPVHPPIYQQHVLNRSGTVEPPLRPVIANYDSIASETLYVPGPVSLSDNVLASLATPSQSHMSSAFATTFKETLQNLYKLVKLDYSGLTFQTKNSKPYQAFVLSGSGTLGFDLIATNFMVDKPTLTKTSKKTLVISTGFFSDNLYKCLKQYFPDYKDPKNFNLVDSNVDILHCPTGTAKFNMKEIKYLLSSNNYQCITLTHVDTSTGVLLDLYKIIPYIRESAPNAIICVDAVCSLGCELIDLNVLDIDFLFASSQKALGCPPGLVVGYISKKLIDYLKHPDISPYIKGYYTNLSKWLPVLESYEYFEEFQEELSKSNSSSDEGVNDGYDDDDDEYNADVMITKGPQYFATPPVQLIHSLNVSLKEILKFGIDLRCEKFIELSKYIKLKVAESFGLELLNENDPSNAAHGLTCVLYKNSKALIKYCNQNFKIDLAGPLIKNIKIKISNKIEIEYFRIGHMSNHILKDFVENDHRELDAFVTILKKAIETVDLKENRKGYSSMSLLEWA